MNSVQAVLLENINNPNSLFVFPTDISSSRWADLLLRLMAENADTAAISMEKFIAWDIFKQNSIKSKVKNKKSIPSALRKIFVSCLINENAILAQEKTPIFSSLIRVEWALQASQFTSWLTAILPQLGAWFNKTTGLAINSITGEKAQETSSKFEGDDKDMFTLALRYAQFLEQHSLFEPAWETPPFNEDGKEVFIFFPESLSDYSEYKDLLANSEHVKIISADDCDKLSSDTFFYSNSRSEITEASLYIRALNEKQNVEWDSIAVCIPDSENYEPYVLREFSNRNIPYVKRTSKPLTDYPAGRFFSSVLDCYSQDFSFDSLVSLVLNKNLPWKDGELIDSLIQFGIKNNCLYSWTEEAEGKPNHINVWEDAFNNPIYYYSNEISDFFKNLKRRVFNFRGAESFAELRKQYFIFREQFFNMDNCTDETNLILSRCISELMNLTELEKNFPDVHAVDPFSFFIDYLSDIFYLPQSKTSGVAILPYKTAAAAPFDCHIILGAGQDSLSVVYSHLNFLPGKKREELGIIDEDASVSFINMHKYNSIKNSAFFCCEQTFSGFTIPHSKIGSPSEPRERYASDAKYSDKFSQDFYKDEINHFNLLPPADDCSEQKLHENQLLGFTEWKKRRFQNASETSADKNWKINDEIQKIISASFAKTGKYSVSATSLHKYYQCSLKWLFESVFKLENIQIETSLMAENISGLVYHAILNNFFTELKNNKPILLEPVQINKNITLPEFYKKLLEKCINEIFSAFPLLKQNKISALTVRLLCAGKNDFKYHLERFLSQFLLYFAGCSVEGSESSYQLERDTYTMRGSVDCILKDADSKYIIIDFKTKYMPGRSDCIAEDGNELADFQLPMYITLTEKTKQYKVYTALFYSIIDLKPEVIIGTISDTNTEKEIPAKKENQINRESERYKIIFKEFKYKTEQFAKEISTGNFTVFPQKSNDCLGCDYQRICRTVYIIDRENNLLGKY